MHKNIKATSEIRKNPNRDEFYITAEQRIKKYEEIQALLQKLMLKGMEFDKHPSIDLAHDLDKDLSIVRVSIGEDKFAEMQYFSRLHKMIVRYIEKEDKQNQIEG